MRKYVRVSKSAKVADKAPSVTNVHAMMHGISVASYDVRTKQVIKDNSTIEEKKKAILFSVVKFENHIVTVTDRINMLIDNFDNASIQKTSRSNDEYLSLLVMRNSEIRSLLKSLLKFALEAKDEIFNALDILAKMYEDEIPWATSTRNRLKTNFLKIKELNENSNLFA